MIATGRAARDLERIESPAVYNMLLALDELQQPSKFDDRLRALLDLGAVNGDGLSGARELADPGAAAAP
ncbi:MAG TPA: hypothetical protein VNO30_05285 [Kofleriaceae bacterium]|nr:hypothetical protein [Kofleriaceae bacterium]